MSMIDDDAARVAAGVIYLRLTQLQAARDQESVSERYAIYRLIDVVAPHTPHAELFRAMALGTPVSITPQH